MRYYLIPNEDPRGLVMRPVATGGSKDGVLSDGCFDLVLEKGKPWNGMSWEHLCALAKDPGYVDGP